MLVANSQLNLQGISLRNINLEDQKLVHYVETLDDADALRLGARPSVMKIGRHLRWIGWQLNALVLQVEDVAFDLTI